MPAVRACGAGIALRVCVWSSTKGINSPNNTSSIGPSQGVASSFIGIGCECVVRSKAQDGVGKGLAFKVQGRLDPGGGCTDQLVHLATELAERTNPV